MRELSAQTGFASHSAQEAQFGLGAADTVDLIVIRWPSGFIQEIGPVATDQLLEPLESDNIPELDEPFLSRYIGYRLTTEQIRVKVLSENDVRLHRLELRYPNGKLHWRRDVPLGKRIVQYNLPTLPAGKYRLIATLSCGVVEADVDVAAAP
jgi:hypothetical protein